MTASAWVINDSYPNSSRSYSRRPAPHHTLRESSPPLLRATHSRRTRPLTPSRSSSTRHRQGLRPIASPIEGRTSPTGGQPTGRASGATSRWRGICTGAMDPSQGGRSGPSRSQTLSARRRRSFRSLFTPVCRLMFPRLSGGLPLTAGLIATNLAQHMSLTPFIFKWIPWIRVSSLCREACHPKRKTDSSTSSPSRLPSEHQTSSGRRRAQRRRPRSSAGSTSSRSRGSVLLGPIWTTLRSCRSCGSGVSTRDENTDRHAIEFVIPAHGI